MFSKFNNICYFFRPLDQFTNVILQNFVVYLHFP